MQKNKFIILSIISLISFHFTTSNVSAMEESSIIKKENLPENFSVQINDQDESDNLTVNVNVLNNVRTVRTVSLFEKRPESRTKTIIYARSTGVDPHLTIPKNLDYESLDFHVTFGHDSQTAPTKYYTINRTKLEEAQTTGDILRAIKNDEMNRSNVTRKQESKADRIILAFLKKFKRIS